MSSLHTYAEREYMTHLYFLKKMKNLFFLNYRYNINSDFVLLLLFYSPKETDPNEAKAKSINRGV